VAVDIYAFYNNKGGVGKTTLCQNVACLYAEENPKKQVLVIDLCPQANISQFLLGGGHIGYETNQTIQSHSTRKNIVGFMDWLLKGNSGFTSIPSSFKRKVSPHNTNVTDNLFLIAGDSFLESFSLALSYAVINPANTQSWKEHMTAIRRLCNLEFDSDNYASLTVFIDCNPSFSIYTQMGLVSSDSLVVPMMADFSSLEGLRGILTLLYGEYPSAQFKKFAENIITFNSQIKTFKLSLPTFYEFVFNNFTSYQGAATAFESVKNELVTFCYQQSQTNPNLFATFTHPITSQAAWADVYVSETKDFHTAGKVSATLGIPLHRLPGHTTYTMPDGEVVKVPRGNYQASLNHVEKLVSKIR
jgi:cellulose biosynthesis protein BcsQ